MAKHPAEPWHVSDHISPHLSLYNAAGGVLPPVYKDSAGKAEATLDRIVACINACAGVERLTPGLVAELVKTLNHIAGLEDRADGTVGLVDHPHVKALRAASSAARAVLAKLEDR